MEMESSNQERVGPHKCGWAWFKGLIEKLRSYVVDFGKYSKKLGEEDPRRIIHSLKVGLAISIVSLIYYFDALFEGFGISAMWAVMTVVVVFEFSVGATLGRGLNRGIATLLAGTLGVGAHRLARFSGEACEPIILGLFVFIIAVMVTFLRFFPRMKARYDYGLLIFNLTFSLVAVSGYQDDEVLDIAHKRLSTILIGGATAVIICICICPVWTGTDLHNQVATNLEKLAIFLEGFGGEYFTNSEDKESENDKSSMQGYKSVLNTKSIEESMVNLAKWEPRHGRFRYRHPWNQYLEIGALTRQCAYTIETLNNYLNSEIKTPIEIREKIKEPCMKMSSESSLALKELAMEIKEMTQSSNAKTHIAHSKIAAKNLKSKLQTGLWRDSDQLLGLIPATTVASLLLDVVICTEKIGKSVHELASLARFKNSDASIESKESKLNQKELVKSCSGIQGHHHVITMDGSSNYSLPNSGGE